MSYILDALKKSEQERQRGEIPDLLSVQDAIPKRPQKRPLWPYVLVGVLLINAGILGWWVMPLQHKKPPSIASPNNTPMGDSTISVPRVQRQTEMVSPGSKTAESRPTPKSEPLIQRHDSTLDAAAKQKVDTLRQHKEAESVAEHSLRESHREDTIETSRTSVPSPENKVYTLGDLPPSIREGLPPFTISMTLYSDDPSARLVKINGTRLREGDYLSAGLKLEEITQDGMIFNFRNYRFHVGVK